MRIGHGYDAHRTVKGKPLKIGGVTIPSDFGLLAHSDGDVLVHAIIDALFGAAGERDIGTHYPDSDNTYKDCDSMALLQDCVRILKEKKMEVDYLDTTVLAQAPKLNPYLTDMRQRLSEALEIDISRINVKATTEEKMGFTGSGEGIAAHAVCILKEEK